MCMNQLTTISKTVALLSVIAILSFQVGCAGPAASKTAKGAGTGAVVGAIGGAIAGEGAGGIAAAGAAGALIGGTIGAVAQSRERKEQANLAQQRAYNQSLTMQRRASEKEKARIQEELDVAEGFRISEAELDEMTQRAEAAEAQLKALQAKRDAALERKKQLDEMEQREQDAIAEAERLERELAELEGLIETTESDSGS